MFLYWSKILTLYSDVFATETCAEITAIHLGTEFCYTLPTDGVVHFIKFCTSKALNLTRLSINSHLWKKQVAFNFGYYILQH